MDRNSLHVLLWLRSTDGSIHINQTHLANELCTTKVIIGRTLRTMIAEQRMEFVGGSGPTPRSYLIMPPAEWVERFAPKTTSDGA